MVGGARAATQFATVVPGEGAINRRRMGIVDAVVHAANNAEPVHLPGQQRQVLAKANAGNRGIDPLERPPDLRRGIRFHVPGIQVAGATIEKQHNGMVSAGFWRSGW